MLGHAVADALGVPVEFCSRDELKSSPVEDMRGFGSHNVPLGTFSDDTSMSIAALDAIKGGKLDYLGVMRNLVNWYYDADYTSTGEVFDIGGTCHRAIRSFKLSGCATPHGHGESGEFSAGNGGVMRIHPFALYAYYKTGDISERLKIIHEATALTHAHPRCLVGSGIFSIILWEVISGGGKEAVLRGAQAARKIYSKKSRLVTKEMAEETVHYDRLLTSLCDEESARLIPESEIRSTGYVVDTVEAAVWSVLTTDDYKSAVLRAVNLGSDTDTVGAVAGALAGALYGYDAIPEKWLSSLLGRDRIAQMCKDLAKI